MYNGQGFPSSTLENLPQFCEEDRGAALVGSCGTSAGFEQGWVDCVQLLICRGVNPFHKSTDILGWPL